MGLEPGLYSSAFVLLGTGKGSLGAGGNAIARRTETWHPRAQVQASSTPACPYSALEGGGCYFKTTRRNGVVRRIRKYKVKENAQLCYKLKP